MEAATAFWHPVEMREAVKGSKILGGKERAFESVENAVRFIMEDLSDSDRGTAMIQTDGRSIHIADIEKMYLANKKAASP